MTGLSRKFSFTHSSSASILLTCTHSATQTNFLSTTRRFLTLHIRIAVIGDIEGDGNIVSSATKG